jgi:DNA-binding HxlR family transcriptional regulator
VSGKRSYNDPCGIARALNLVGERWALLVVRELLLGPKRFVDLHRGLPTVSQNVLSQRLRELERDGVLRRRRLGPPVGAWVYELTEWGRELEPVLLQLGRWGLRADTASTSGPSADSTVLALRDRFVPEAAGDLRGDYELRLGDDSFRVRVGDGRVEFVRGAADSPDAVIDTDIGTLWSLTSEEAVDNALRTGTLRAAGDQQTVKRFFALFRP